MAEKEKKHNMVIHFEEKTVNTKEDKEIIESVIRHYEDFFAFQTKEGITVDFSCEKPREYQDIFQYQEFSKHKNRDGKYVVSLLDAPIHRAEKELQYYYKQREGELSTCGKKVLADFKSYMERYSYAREIYVWLLFAVDGVDLWSDESRNNEKEHFLAALQRFFAVSFMEEHYSREERIWFFKFLDVILEYQAPVSMYCYGDRLFTESTVSIAGQKIAAKDMPAYRKLIEICRKEKYEEGIKYLISRTKLENKRRISREEYEDYKSRYYPDRLSRRTDNNSVADISEMEKNALLFLWEDCDMFVHTYPDKYEIDDNLLCMYQAIHEFMETGSKYNAIDIYNCYCRRFLRGDKMQEFINMISSYENNASRLVQSHRDHYSHSVYVFILGLAIFHTSNAYRNSFVERHFGSFALKDIKQGDVNDGFINLDLIDFYCGMESGELNFLRLWGLTALFHDIGYQYEIPFAQIRNTSDEKIIFRYEGFKEYTDFDKYIDELEKTDETHLVSVSNRTYSSLEEYKKRLFLFDSCYSDGDCSIEQIIAYHILRFLKKERGCNFDYVTELLRKKPSPTFDNPYMDHAYFSGIIMFKQLISMFGLDDFPVEFMDAISAIVMHNKLFEYYLRGNGESLDMWEHPLAYLLILCDELQCWDRTSFGKGSIQQLHAIDARIRFRENAVEAEYIFDKRYIDHVFDCDKGGHITKVSDGTIKKFFKGNKKGDGYITPALFDINNKDSYKVSQKDFLDANSYMDKKESKDAEGRVCKFAADIANIVEIILNENDKEKKAIALSVKASFDYRDKYRHEYLSETSMRNLYSMAKDLFTVIEKEDDRTFEYALLADKLAYIAFVRNMGECLQSVGCFYTNEPKAFEIMEDFSESKEQEDEDKLATMVDIERREMSRFCKAHLIEEFPERKLQKMVKAFIKIICESRGVEVYKL